MSFKHSKPSYAGNGRTFRHARQGMLRQTATSITLAIIALIVSVSATKASTVFLDDSCEVYSLRGSLEFLEDPEGDLTITEVSSPSFRDKFRNAGDRVPSFGYTKSAYWVKLQVKNRSSATVNWVLEHGFAFIHNVDFYSRDNSTSGYRSVKTGLMHPPETRDYHHHRFLFRLDIPQGFDKTIYIRVKTQGPMTFPLYIRTIKAFQKKASLALFIHGTFFGVLFFLVAYHTFLYISLREREYLYFVLFNLLLGLFSVTYTGLGTYHLWPDIPFFQNNVMQLVFGLGNISILVFANSFLKVRDYFPILHNILRSLVAFFALLVLISPFTTYITIIPVMVVLGILSQFILLITGIHLHFKKHYQSDYFLVGYLFLFSGYLSTALTSLGILASTAITENLYQLGFAMQAVIWSLGLAERIRKLRDQAQEANRELTMHRDNLETMVKERTLSLSRSEDRDKRHIAFLKNMETIAKTIGKAESLDHMTQTVLAALMEILKCDRAFLIFPADPDSPTWSVPMECTTRDYPGAMAMGVDLPMNDEVAATCRLVLASEGPVRFDPESPHTLPEENAKGFGFKSQILSAIHPHTGKPWILGVHQCTHARTWTQEEVRLVSEIGYRIGDALSSLLFSRDLREREELFRSISSSARDAIVMIDQSGKIRYWNRAAREFFQIPENQALGMEMKSLIDGDDEKERFDTQLREFSRTGQWRTGHAIMETTFKRPNGSTFPMEISVGTVKRDGKWNAIGILRDLTERRMVEAEQITQQNLLNAVMNVLPVGFFSKDRKGRYLLVNNAFADCIGTSPENVRGKTVQECWPIMESRIYHEKDLALMEEGGLQEYEYLLPHATRGRVPGIFSKACYYNADGSVGGIVGIFFDMSEQKASKEKLENALGELESIFANSQVGILLLTPDRKVSKGNRRAVDIFGYDSQSSIIGMSVDGHYPSQKDSIEFRNRFYPILKQGGHVETEQQLQKKDGTAIWCSLSGKALDTNTPPDISRGVLWIIDDITDRKRAEEALKKARDVAENANRAKSEFLANMSHELRTPLNAVIGFSELLYSSEKDPKQKNHVESIHTAGKSLLTLINDILDLSKIEAGKLEIHEAPLRLANLFHELRLIFREMVKGKGLAFKTNIDENIPDTLMLDETRLRQILLNLVGNAVKFTDSGEIILSARMQVKNGENLKLSISVEDTGIGIEEHALKYIFESFRQLDSRDTRQFGGSGLGLSISKRLAEVMQGQISATSTPGAGSCFTLTLGNVLISGTNHETARTGGHINNCVSFKTALVLVVDDIASNRQMLKAMLSNMNLSVVTAENGKEAINVANKRKPDLIIMDIRMPVMDGNAAMGRIKNMREIRDIPVIALTASARKEDRDKIMRHGFSGLLLKPVSGAQLTSELTNHLEHSMGERSDLVEQNDQIPLMEQFRIPQAAQKHLPEIAGRLKDEMMPRAMALKGIVNKKEIWTFAREILTMGETHGITGLKNYAETLLVHESNFDIAAIEMHIEKFPEIVDIFIELAKKK